MKLKKWIKSSWTISISTALFSFLLIIVRDYIKNLPILSTIFSLFSKLSKLIISIFMFELKIWWIIVGLGFLVSVIYVIDKFKIVRNMEPDFTEYEEDILKNGSGHGNGDIISINKHLK